MDPASLADLVTAEIKRTVCDGRTATRYREPLIRFVAADDPGFQKLRSVVEPSHMKPQDLVSNARSVVSYFLPFDSTVIEANAQDRKTVAWEWAAAYVETNALIGRITTHLVEVLAKHGVRAAAEPATHNFDPHTLVSRWSHKSVAVLAGLGSFGLHHLLITDAGCAGRLGSLVVDADLPANPLESRERCLFFHDGSCLECVLRCPVDALDENGDIDKQRCWVQLSQNARQFLHIGRADVCGKCSIGPCSFGSAV
jgi:epoxyqueuosine reductase QueG